MRPHMLRPWNLGEPVGHLMEQVVPSCLRFWLILWGAWVPGRARRVLEEGASTCRRSSPPSWYEPLSCPSPASLALHSPSARLPICLRLRVLPFFSVDLVLNVLALQGSPNSHPSEELLKQADYSDKIKQMLGNAQGQPPGLGEGTGSGLGGARVLPLGGKTREGKTGQRAALCQVGGKGWLDAPKREDIMLLFSNPLADCFTPYSTVPHGLLGPGPIANGFPPGGPGGPKGMQHFPPGPGGPMPGRWRASGWKGLVCWIEPGNSTGLTRLGGGLGWEMVVPRYNSGS